MTERIAAGSRDVLERGGAMGSLIRSLDWSQAPLGAPEGWSPSLRTMVKILIANRFPLLLWWGPDQCQLYNDAYRPVLGTKHPRSMGQPARECWPEIWHIIGPLILTPYNGGPATWDDDLFLGVNRYGFLEETHFTIADSPVPDDSQSSGIGGVLAAVHEITQQVIQERRLAVLRDLGARSAEAKTAEEACEIAAEAFGRHPTDVPFALLYLTDAEQPIARLAASAGIGMGEPVSPVSVDLTDPEASWPLAEVARTEEPRVVENLTERFGAVLAGPWSDPPGQAIVLPVPSNIQHRLAGLLVLGISARLALDDLYRGFCDLATAQVATAIANARAYDEERRRAEALAELDRAKTTFFSNVSHEFRTPLTLSLGPVEDALADADHPFPTEQRQRLEIVHRNQLRLLKLVSSLLDFSRIEADRIQASYEPTDLAALTADLASVFRSAIERASLGLIVDCPPLPEPVYVDRGMWEKVVLNLLSNAFKHTFEGRIVLTQRWCGDHIELEVRDTGVGIPEAELPRIVERFHRVEGARARTFDGTGIGLTLVQELVRLHRGTVAVASVDGAWREAVP